MLWHLILAATTLAAQGKHLAQIALLMLLFGLVVGALPSLRAMRLNIVDALAGR